MMRPRILVVGAGGHARSCVDVLEAESRFEIAGFVGALAERGKRCVGYEVLGTDDDLPALRHEVVRALIAVGQIKSPDRRIQIFDRLIALGFKLPIIVSPLAHISAHAEVGRGTIAMHGAMVNAGASVGSNCILNSRSLVEHDVVVGDHCHISTAAVVNGGVTIGEGSFVGSGSVIREGVAIGRRCVIGMGASVRTDQPDGARVLREE